MSAYVNPFGMLSFSLWFLTIATFSTLALTPNFHMVQGVDKIAHIAGFFILMLWPTLKFKHHQHILILASLFACSGIAVELIQNYMPGRQYSFADILANISGIMAGLSIGLFARS